MLKQEKSYFTRIYLTGFKCSGKTTLGKMLAPVLGFKFIDLDDLIESIYEQTIPELYSKFGEDDFRTLERKAFDSILNESNVVISTGGGFPRWRNNMDIMLNTGISVYMKVPNNILYERMHEVSAHRPILNGWKDQALMEYIITLKSNYESIYERARVIYSVDKMTFLQLIEDLTYEIYCNK